MVRSLFFVFFVFTSLIARENPFFPSVGEKEISLTSNQEMQLAPLKRATLTLPSTARAIEGVSIHYRKLDGSRETKSIDLDNSVDWRLPIFISQSYEESEPKNAIKEKIKKKPSYKKIASIKLASFWAHDKKLKIITKDTMIRNFLLVRPHRIVCDFKKDTDIKSYVKNISKDSRFTKIRIGNHDGYYRVVIELDGYYRYEKISIEDGYILELQ